MPHRKKTGGRRERASATPPARRRLPSPNVTTSTRVELPGQRVPTTPLALLPNSHPGQDVLQPLRGPPVPLAHEAHEGRGQDDPDEGRV